MNLKKISKNDPVVYRDVYGRTVYALEPGKDGVTQADIDAVRKCSNNEVENNLKALRCCTSKEYTKKRDGLKPELIKDFYEKNNRYPYDFEIKDALKKASHKNWTIPLELVEEYYADITSWEWPYINSVFYEPFMALDNINKLIFTMVWVNGYPNVQVAYKLGISEAAVRKRKKKIKDLMYNYFLIINMVE